MHSKYEKRCVRDVVKIERVIKQGGGRMRPTVRAYNRCTLICGHTQDRIKPMGDVSPPVRMTCLECQSALLDDQATDLRSSRRC